MELRQLGNSDLHITPVILGAWTFGGWYWGGADDTDSIRAIDAAIHHGINCIDTAPIYGFGHSEEIVGKAIKGKRNDLIIATKCALRWDKEEGEFFFETDDNAGKSVKVFKNLSAASIREECERSLRLLGIDHIDLYQCHWMDSTTPHEETMAELSELQQEGKIREIGVSNYSPEAIRECLQHAKVVSDQPQYNLLQREIEAEVLPTCRQYGLGVLCYSPMCQGLLTGKVTMDRTFDDGDFRADHTWFQPENRKRVLNALDEVKDIAETHKITLAQLALSWVAGEPGVTAAIAGARTPKQAEENAAAGAVRLSKEERQHLRSVFEGLGDPVEA